MPSGALGSVAETEPIDFGGESESSVKSKVNAVEAAAEPHLLPSEKAMLLASAPPPPPPPLPAVCCFRCASAGKSPFIRAML